MSNTVTDMFALLLPHKPDNPNVQFQQKIIAFAVLLSILVATYSMIKWYNIGYDDFAKWGWFLLVGAPLVGVMNKLQTINTMALSNIMCGLFTSYGMTLVFYHGGIDSVHIFWVVSCVLFAFLITNNFYGLLWGTVCFGYVIYLINAKYSGTELPYFELTPEQLKVNEFSGYLLPLFVSYMTMWYGNKIRHDALQEAQETATDALTQSQNASALSDKMSQVLAKAKSSVATLIDSSGDLSNTMDSMLTRNQQINQNIAQQSEASQSVNSTMQELVEAVQQSSEIMKQVKAHSQAVAADIDTSARAMDQAIEIMANIQNSNDDIARAMDIITEIADQTNLLALNAAIEAARAGDHGRGFAVVADEVRTLSIRSNDSAQSIRKLLEKATVDIQNGVEVVNRSGESLSTVVNSVQEIDQQLVTADNIAEIQKSSLNNVVNVNKQVEDAMQQSVEVITEQVESTQSLADISTQLNLVANQTNQLVEASQ